MKKKNKILTIISSTFGLIAICGGLFACSLSKSEKKIETRASANLSSLENANMYVASSDLTQYPLYEVNPSPTYTFVGGLSSNGWLVNFNSTYTFTAGYVYELYVDLGSTNVTNLLSLGLDTTLSSYSTNLDSTNGRYFKQVSSTIYTKTFRVERTYGTSNIAYAFVSGSMSFNNVSFEFYSGFYHSDSYFLYPEVEEQLYSSYGFDVFYFYVNFYYNGILYNGLQIYMRYTVDVSINHLYVTTLDYNPLYNTGYAFIMNSKYNSSSDLQFIDGNDISNPTLLSIMNLVYTLRSFNNYDDTSLSVEQYNAIIADLNNQISILNNDLNNLSQQNSYLETQMDYMYQSGYNDGVESIENQLVIYYNNGKAEGFNEGLAANGTAMTIMSGILQVALVPVNFFLGIFNFEVLGINFTSLIQVIFTIALTIIIVKVVIGKKGE